MIMYSDRLSQLSLKKDKYWPFNYLNSDWGVPSPDPYFTPEQVASFNLSGWIDQKLAIPNDGLPRIHHHPNVEFLLTDEELEAFNQDLAICSPVLCPKIWEKGEHSPNESYDRFEWLSWQYAWARYGYPRLPQDLVEQDESWGIIFEKLVYEPFLTYWKNIPDDFWVKLSYILEQENTEDMHRGIILVFLRHGRIFPCSTLYNPSLDSQQKSLYLPDSYFEDLFG
jgi:hypothetical protein